MGMGENICNMLECRAGEHCLFRSFGLGGTVDDPNRITRNNIQVHVNKWFPGVIVEAATIEKATASGEFVYNIKCKGV